MDPVKIGSEKVFGKNWGALGTLESTKVLSRVNAISDTVEGAFIGLSAMQTNNLNSSFGTFSLKNPHTQATMQVDIYNAYGPYCTTHPEEIIITKLVADTLNIKAGSPIEIERKLDDIGAVKWACKNNTDNHFGQDWVHRSYGAIGTLVSYCKDTVEGRPEIYFTHMQKKYLRLEKHLYPLCGIDKYTELKKNAPEALGIVRIQCQGKVLEVDAYTNNNCSSYSGSAILISHSLMKQLGEKTPLGTQLTISSRFDLPIEEALDNTNPPKITMTANPLQFQDAFAHLRNTSLEELENDFSTYQASYSFVPHAHFLNALTEQAHLVAAHPEIFQKLTHFLVHRVYRSFEYSRFLNALKEHKAILIHKWDDYVSIIREELLKQESDCTNPQILHDFIKIGFVNQQDSKGETVIHLSYSLNKGSFELESKKHNIAFNIQNHQGQTPLHLCAGNDKDGWKNIILNKNKLNPLIQDNHQRLPLHVACMHHNMAFIRILFESYPHHAKTFLETVDAEGKTPFDYLSPEDILLMLLSYARQDNTNEPGWKLALEDMMKRSGLTVEIIIQLWNKI